MNKPLIALHFLLCLALLSCKKSSSDAEKNSKEVHTSSLKDSVVYRSENLHIKKYSPYIYEHISFLETNDFGKVACNGMLVINQGKGILFDTPTNDESSMELLDFVTHALDIEIMAFIPTHFHEDCIGGLSAFEQNDIPMYVSKRTLAALEEKGQKFSKPVETFLDSLDFDLGDKKVYARYFGEGHTRDNIIGYFPDDQTIFGGCLIKTVGAGKGYLGDANTNEWSNTVLKIKSTYPNVTTVIPGHGDAGGTALLDYTIKLFKK